MEMTKLEDLPLGLLLVNREMKIVYASNHLLEMLGYEPAELIGQSIEVLVPEDFRGHHPAMTHQFMRDPKPRLLGHGRDLFARQKDGNTKPVEIALIPQPESHVLVVLIDILVRKSLIPVAEVMSKVEQVARDIEKRLTTPREV